MIQEVKLSDIPGRATSYNNQVQADIREFLETDWPVAEVGTAKYKSINSACCAYRTAVKRMGVDCIVTMQSGRLFLMRK